MTTWLRALIYQSYKHCSPWSLFAFSENVKNMPKIILEFQLMYLTSFRNKPLYLLSAVGLTGKQNSLPHKNCNFSTIKSSTCLWVLSCLLSCVDWRKCSGICQVWSCGHAYDCSFIDSLIQPGQARRKKMPYAAKHDISQIILEPTTPENRYCSGIYIPPFHLILQVH